MLCAAGFLRLGRGGGFGGVAGVGDPALSWCARLAGARNGVCRIFLAG